MKRTRVKPVNRKRAAEKHARNFGEEAERVRAMTCVTARPSAWLTTISQDAQWLLAERTECSGDNVVMHVESRGAGGGRLDTVCACAHHHDEQHLIGIKSFAARYRLDLRAKADAAALEHPRPLGIRGLADRWAAFEDAANVQLDTYEWDALMGWVRREMAREVARRRVIREATENQRRWCGFVPHAEGDETAVRTLLAAGMLREEWLESEDESAEDVLGYGLTTAGAERFDDLDDNDREALAHHVAQVLGIDQGVALNLCEAAAERFGWPS